MEDASPSGARTLMSRLFKKNQHFMKVCSQWIPDPHVNRRTSQLLTDNRKANQDDLGLVVILRAALEPRSMHETLGIETAKI